MDYNIEIDNNLSVKIRGAQFVADCWTVGIGRRVEQRRSANSTVVLSLVWRGQDRNPLSLAEVPLFLLLLLLIFLLCFFVCLLLFLFFLSLVLALIFLMFLSLSLALTIRLFLFLILVIRIVL